MAPPGTEQYRGLKPASEGVTFTNVHLSLPGGHGAMSTGVPSDSGDYNPRSIGTRPAYGWYLHEVSNITFNASTVDFGKNDGRPAFLANAGNNITLDHFTAEHGSGSPFDIGFQNITGFCVRSPALSNGGTPNVNSSGSSKSC